MAQQPEKDDVFPAQIIPQDDTIPDDMALLNALADLGQTDNDAKVNVYRADAIKGNRGGAFLFTCSPDEFTLEKLRDEYGGGNYRVHVRANGGIVANKLVAVEEPKNKPQAPVAQIAADVMQPITAMTQAMISGFENLGKLIVAAQVQQQGRKEMLEEMLLYKNMFSSSSQPQQNPFEIFKEALALTKELVPGAGGESEMGATGVMMKLLDKFGEPLSNVLLQAQANKASTSSAPPIVQANSQAIQLNPAALTAPVHAALPKPEDDAIMAQMKQYLNFLIEQAKQNNDVYTYAGMVLDMAPQEQVDAMLERDDWLTMLATFEPDVLNYAPWFTNLRAAMLEMLTPESEPDNNDGTLSNLSGSNATGNT
jgi:hypothetical protein